MENKKFQEKLVTVIIPVYNTPQNFILDCLNSVAGQTLNKRDFDVLLVDDCSENPETLNFLDKVGRSKKFNGVDIRIIRHEENKWLAAARRTGAENAKGKYIVFLDSDDLLDKEYLKKALLLLETSPEAGWVYANTRMFGYFDSFFYAPEFNAFKLFFQNYCISASFFRKSAWMGVCQREKFVVGKIRFFEDWDTTIRMMARGWYGLALNDSEFKYRQSYKSMVVRTPKILTLSNYLVWRLNILSFFKIFRAQNNYRDDLIKGFRRKRSVFNPLRILDSASSFFAKKLLQTHTYVSREEKVFFPFKLLFYSIFFPQKFIKKYLDLSYNITLAEKSCGFIEKPRINFKKALPFDNRPAKSIIFAHNSWRFGGAENVLLNWIKSAGEMSGLKIIDLAENSLPVKGLKTPFFENELEMLRQDFSRYANEQYALDKIAKSPLKKLNFFWNLIAKENPDVLFISSAHFAYSLLPILKREFPRVKIADILHSEEIFGASWFAVSDEYKEYLDKRIVVSEVFKDVLVKKYNERQEKIKVFRNTVDISRYNPQKYNKTKMKKMFGIKPDKFVVGFMGRLDREKNPMVFLELAEQMKNIPEFKFIIVGAGSMENEIKERLSFLSNVKFFGYSHDIRRYLSMCDVLVAPSIFEGSPLIGLESAAMNVPIIATDVIGFREYIASGKFGFLYEQKNTLSDARKIMELILSNKDKFSKVGENGRAFVLKHHNLKKRAAEYKNFIESLLA